MSAWAAALARMWRQSTWRRGGLRHRRRRAGAGPGGGRLRLRFIRVRGVGGLGKFFFFPPRWCSAAASRQGGEERGVARSARGVRGGVGSIGGRPRRESLRGGEEEYGGVIVRLRWDCGPLRWDGMHG
jgi:hypothetical protein